MTCNFSTCQSSIAPYTSWPYSLSTCTSAPSNHPTMPHNIASAYIVCMYMNQYKSCGCIIMLLLLYKCYYCYINAVTVIIIYKNAIIIIIIFLCRRPPTPRPVDPPVIDLTVPSLETIRIDVNLHQPPSSPPPPSSSSSSSTSRLVPTSNPYTSSHTFYRHHGHFVRPRPYNLRPRPQQTPSAPPSTTTPTTSTPEAPLTLDSDSEDDLVSGYWGCGLINS